MFGSWKNWGKCDGKKIERKKGKDKKYWKYIYIKSINYKNVTSSSFHLF